MKELVVNLFIIIGIVRYIIFYDNKLFFIENCGYILFIVWVKLVMFVWVY